jgi:hypothetical protein
MTQLIAEPAATDDRWLEESRSPGGQRGWRLIAVLGALIALGPLSVDLYLPSLPAIRTGLRTTPAGVQLTLTGIMVGMAVGNEPCSFLHALPRLLLTVHEHRL